MRRSRCRRRCSTWTRPPERSPPGPACALVSGSDQGASRPPARPQHCPSRPVLVGAAVTAPRQHRARRPDAPDHDLPARSFLALGLSVGAISPGSRRRRRTGAAAKRRPGRLSDRPGGSRGDAPAARFGFGGSVSRARRRRVLRPQNRGKPPPAFRGPGTQHAKLESQLLYIRGGGHFLRTVKARVQLLLTQ